MQSIIMTALTICNIIILLFTIYIPIHSDKPYSGCGVEFRRQLSKHGQSGARNAGKIVMLNMIANIERQVIQAAVVATGLLIGIAIGPNEMLGNEVPC